jgi:hypothetical protein
VVIPWELHVYEDAWLHHYVRCRGWESVINPVGVTHYSPFRTDLKTQKRQLELAIHVAFKYGIVEYNVFGEVYASIAKQALGLFRPILGTPLMSLVYIRTYGLRKGLPYALKRQYLKLWFRWGVLKNTIRYGEPPNICEVMQNFEEETGSIQGVVLYAVATATPNSLALARVFGLEYNGLAPIRSRYLSIKSTSSLSFIHLLALLRATRYFILASAMP